MQNNKNEDELTDTEAKEWEENLDRRLEAMSAEERAQFWQRILLDMAAIKQMWHMEELRQKLREDENKASINCGTCKNWEKHLDKWPHNPTAFDKHNGSNPAI